MSLLRYLAAGLACRWGGFPRSEKVRVVVFAVSVPLAALVAWLTATPPGGLTVSMRSLTDTRAYAGEPLRRNQSGQEDSARRATMAPAGLSAKVTFESRPTAGTSGAEPAAGGRHDARPEASTVRGKPFEDAVPRFRKDGARGDSSIAGGSSGQ